MQTAFEVAARWWADRLRDCRHSGLSPEERRDPANKNYQFAELLMTMNRPVVSDEQIEAFRLALRRGLESDAAASCVAVDYGPDPILGNALEAAQIPDRSTLPIKTVMWIHDDGSVRVKYGYGAEIQEIRPADNRA